MKITLKSITELENFQIRDNLASISVFFMVDILKRTKNVSLDYYQKDTKVYIIFL